MPKSDEGSNPVMSYGLKVEIVQGKEKDYKVKLLDQR